MRTRKLVTESGILNAPDHFLFIPIGVRESDQLNPPLQAHLVSLSPIIVLISWPESNSKLQTEQLLVSHFHDPEDGFVYLEENDWLSDGQLSAASVVHNPKPAKMKRAKVDATVIFSSSTFALYD